VLRIDACAADGALCEAVSRELGACANAQLFSYGALSASEVFGLSAQANGNRPAIRPVDAYGRRIDRVEFHPALHRLMQLGVEHCVTGCAWRHADTHGTHAARAALMFLHYQA
jgi:putative acyl-CoA dehydrogenase